MASVFYLDVDDEITSAAARIRASEDPRVGLVVPPGSRIATSRINFRLLAREALERNRALSIVSPDPAARALAASAGLPVFATVGEYEASQGDQLGTPSAGAAIAGAAAGAAATGQAAGARAGSPDDTLVMPVIAAAAAGGAIASGSASGSPSAGSAGLAGLAGSTGRGSLDARVGARSGATSAPVVRPAGGNRRASASIALTAIALILILAILGVAAIFLLPSAAISITPKVEAVGPLQLTIRADPTVTAPDPVAGVVPAIQLSKDFASVSTFNATGKKTSTTTATGTVKFTNYDTTGPTSIPAGSKVSTNAGVVFSTAQDVIAPRAQIIPPVTIKPGTASVAVTAVAGGPSGNVPAGAIRVIPSGYSAILLKVTNPAATSGGTATSTTVIQKSDTDAAVATLTKGLRQQFAAWLVQPDALPPGSTAFPKTGALSPASPDTDPATLVGLAQPTFELTMTATGTETAVDESTVTAMAVDRIQAEVPAQYTLVPGSEKVAIGPTQVQGETVIFPVTVIASQVRHLDPDTLRQMVQGKSVDEARAILSEYGAVDIQTWPGFVGSIPSLAWRLTLTIDTGNVTPSPGPSSRPSVPDSSQPSSVPSSGPSASTASP